MSDIILKTSLNRWLGKCVINSSSFVSLPPTRWSASVLLQFVLRRWFLRFFLPPDPVSDGLKSPFPLSLSLCSCVPCANNCGVLQKRNHRSVRQVSSCSLRHTLSLRTLTATSSAPSQFVKCGQVQNKGKYLHHRPPPPPLPLSLRSPSFRQRINHPPPSNPNEPPTMQPGQLLSSR